MNTYQHPSLCPARKLRGACYSILFLLVAVFATHSSGAQQEALQIDNSGNVGIGMVPKNSTKLAVGGRAEFADTVVIGTILPPAQSLSVKGNIYTVVRSPLPSVHSEELTGKTRIGMNSGEFTGMEIETERFNCGNGGIIKFFTWGCNASTTREVVRINEWGRVGIGRSEPSAALDVNGRIKDQTGYVTPRGGIIMYTGTYASLFDGTGKGKPGTDVEGWALCNGSNGTPDLRGRFVVGAGPNSGYGNNTGDPAGKGGNTHHTITLAEMPSHNHFNRLGGGGGNSDADNKDNKGNSEGYGKTDGKFKTYTSFEGGGQQFDTRPPYYAVFYIMKL